MNPQIDTLLRQAEQLSFGHARADLTREAVNLADVERNLELQFQSRLKHVKSLVFSAQPAEAIVNFVWLLNHREEYGDRSDYNFLWAYKWIIDSAIEIADFSKSQVEHFIADARTRFEAYLGPEVRPIESIEINYRIQRGEFDTARRLVAKVENSNRGQLSDCLACERSRRAIDWFQLGEPEKAAATNDDFLKKRLSCSEEPTRTNSRAALYYVTVGRHEDAATAYRSAAAQAQKTDALILKCARFAIAYKLLAGKPADAIPIFDRSLRVYLNSIEKWPSFEFYLISHRLMEQQADAGKKQVRLKSAALLPFMAGSDSPVPIGELSAWLRDQAKEIGAKFDARNDATFFAERLDAGWPFVVGAPS
ncbi:MAG TPA: hypothetical protein VGE67_14495 [Haloferula sp.]